MIDYKARRFAEMVTALHMALHTLRELADKAGNVPEFNDGGHARETCREIRRVLSLAE